MNTRLLAIFLSVSFLTITSNSIAGLKIVGGINNGKSIKLSSQEPTYRALIIGNDAYQDPNKLWKPLKRAVSDSKSVEKLLKENYGFSDVQRLEDVTRRELLHGLRDFSKRVMSQDNVLVYYAGHGFLDQYNNKGYWVPIDAEGTDHTTFVRNSTIRDELSDISSRAKHTLLISDSCFSGTLLKTASRGAHSNTQSKDYLNAVNSKKSVQILTAGGVEYVDDDFRASGHSPFTYFLRSELENNPYPVITASDLSQRVKLAVSNNVDQKPQMGVLQGAGDELGEFLFIKVNLEVSGVPADRVKVDVNVVSDVDSSITQKNKNDKTPSATPNDTPETPAKNKTKQENKNGVVLPVQSF
ncbi:MAG: caspase family protein [Agarilytica sp.]